MIECIDDTPQSVAPALHPEGLNDPVIGKLVDAIDTPARCCETQRIQPVALNLTTDVSDSPAGAPRVQTSRSHQENVFFDINLEKQRVHSKIDP